MEKELEIYLEKLVEESVFPGCNYGIITSHKKYFGSVGYKSLIPVEERNSLNNIYDMASITKLLVTNTLLSFLIRDKKIKLEDSVKMYLPEFPYEDIQVLHLLTHSSGLKPTFDKFHLHSKKEFLLKVEREFLPGSNVCYVDVNFILLGFIIEKIYQEKLDIIAHKFIFEPLEMKDTMYNPTDISKCVPMEYTVGRGLVCGTVHDEKASFLNGIAGHAGVFSTVEDISHFIDMVLNDGYYHGKEFLEKKYIDTWFTPLFIGEDNVRRTLGWIYGKSSRLCSACCGEDCVVHTGFPGHHILIDRTNDVGIIFLSNAIHPSRENKKIKDERQHINCKIYELLKKYDQI